MFNSELLSKQAIRQVIHDLNPQHRVKQVLSESVFTKSLHMLAIGKAAWDMAQAAYTVLGDRINKALVITKHGHSKGKIGHFNIMEAGHPIPDEASIKAGHQAIEQFSGLKEGDELIFLISGGGSALFEVLFDGITLEDLQQVTQRLMASGMDIKKMNAVRKRLSLVKGGQFAEIVAPASIQAFIISDVLGDSVADIASGPVTPEELTPELSEIASQLNLEDPAITRAIQRKLPKKVENVQVTIIDNVVHACQSAKRHFEEQGIPATIITTCLECEAKEAGQFIATMIKDIYKKNSDFTKPHCLIFGGETLVHLHGTGKGGRNQELALSAAIALDGLKADCCLFSLGTDGTDGPTDAAGGIVTPETVQQMKAIGINPSQILKNNDSYHALEAVKALIKTGPTGTNVNDLICAVLL
ncbi:MAG: glycerate kinase [Thermotogota bacterium]|nr:glycerate kinase [Thermotogota bacterium]